MADSPRRLAIVRRYSLADLGPGWDSNCYIEYRPASIGEQLALSQLQTDNLTEAEASAKTLEFVKSFIVGGSVLVLNDEGKPTIDRFTQDDVSILPSGTIGELLRLINGGQLDDPKASPEEVVGESRQDSSETDTETSSSEG